MRNRLAMLNCGIMTPFPGTAVYDKAERDGLLTDRNWEHYTGGNLVWRHPTLDKEEMERAYVELRRAFYSWPSICKRFWANRKHPLYYFVMNFTHWWRAYRNPYNKIRYPSVAPRGLGLAPGRWGARFAPGSAVSVQGVQARAAD